MRRVALEESRQTHPERTLVLLCAPIAYQKELLQTLQAQFGAAYTMVGMQEGLSLQDTALLSASELGQAGLLARVTQAKTVILLAPRLELLRQIAVGDDRDFTAYLMIRAVLWKKDVRLYLDFDPPRFLRNTFLEGVASAIDTLRQMQVTICPYFEGDRPQDTQKQLVTEADVLEAAQTKEKTILCRSGAIITPAARDALQGREVIVRYEGETLCN